MSESYRNRYKLSVRRFFFGLSGRRWTNLGMRLEAQRRGAEDAALWQLLREKDEKLHDELIGKMFTNNYTYNDDPARFQEVYEELLAALE